MTRLTFQTTSDGRAVQPDQGSAEAAMPSERLGRVLFVTSNFPRWEGDSTTPFVLHLAEDLQALGWQVDVLAPHAPGAPVRETLRGVSVMRFRYAWPETLQTLCYQGGALVNLRKRPAKALQLPAFVLAEWLAVVRRLASGRYDLLNSHWILPQGFTGALAAGPLGIPHVATVHGGDVFALRGRVLSAFKRFALRRADAVTVNSSATAAAVTEIAPDVPEIRRIPMGVSDARPGPAADVRGKYRRGNGPCLIFVGRVVEEKGVADLIRAVSLLAADLPDVSAVIVGEGPDRPAMEHLAQGLGVAERVAFTGWIETGEVTGYLAAADIFVGPSRTASDGWVEAQGLTFLEAMLAGIPVIATRTGGIIDAVRHEETGLLVSEASPEEIGAAVKRLVAEPDLTRRLCDAGADLVHRNFTRGVSAKAFGDLFREMVLRRQAGRMRSPN
jgi:glycosyltransferase involved in cell wall biosynthesis